VSIKARTKFSKSSKRDLEGEEVAGMIHIVLRRDISRGMLSSVNIRLTLADSVTRLEKLEGGEKVVGMIHIALR